MASREEAALMLTLVLSVKAGRWLDKCFAEDATCYVVFPPSSISGLQ